MSGGTFNYEQHHIQTLITEMEEKTNWVKEEYPIYVYVAHLNAIRKLKHAFTHVQRLDWLFAGDDGETTYKKRLKEELKELRKQDDKRPKLDGWAPGNYTNTCQMCNKEFIGDKRAFFCAPCAYGDNK